MAQSEFASIIRAARQFETGNWNLADELHKHAEGTLTGPKGLKAVASALADAGMDYSTEWLRQLRLAAETFPEDRRHLSVGIKIHMAAGSPDMMDAIMKIAKREDRSLSLHSVERIMAQLAREERAERDQKAKEAEEEAKQAAKEEAEAKSEPARERAREKKKAAKQRAQRERGAPGRKQRATKPPKEDDAPFLLARVQFAADVKQIAKFIKRMNSTLKPVLDQLTPSFCNNAVEELLECANDLRRLSDLIEKNRPSGAKRGHLYAV